MRTYKQKGDKDWMESKIKEGKSSEDIARSLGTTRYRVRKLAKDYGLEFKGKSCWRKY
jgi:hypothetical protein